jgi:hypothetical protein
VILPHPERFVPSALITNNPILAYFSRNYLTEEGHQKMIRLQNTEFLQMTALHAIIRHFESACDPAPFGLEQQQIEKLILEFYKQ